MISIEQLVFQNNSKRTRWFKCRICGDQFITRRLLAVHKKVPCSKGED